MLARSAAAPPSGPGWSYEPKLGGYRCMVDTHHGFRARSRRGWAMAELVPELEQLPPGLMLDGEFVSFDAEGRASFDLLGRRMFMRDRSIAVCFLAFDLLAIDGVSTLAQPYHARRTILEAIDFGGPCWATVPAFDDGEALWRVVIKQRLEGLVAKPIGAPYVPGDRRIWAKVKNPDWPRREFEREAVARARERRRRRAYA